MQNNFSGGTLLGSQDEGKSGESYAIFLATDSKQNFPFQVFSQKTSCRLSTSLICQPLPPGLITPLDITSRLSQTGSDFVGKELSMVNCESVCDDDKLERLGS